MKMSSSKKLCFETYPQAHTSQFLVLNKKAPVVSNRGFQQIQAPGA